jgi:hypothetical protein
MGQWHFSLPHFDQGMIDVLAQSREDKLNGPTDGEMAGVWRVKSLLEYSCRQSPIPTSDRQCAPSSLFHLYAK